MGELLLGFALGAMAFTEKGREIGNMIGSTAFAAVKKAVKNVSENKPAE